MGLITRFGPVLAFRVSDRMVQNYYNNQNTAATLILPDAILFNTAHEI